MYENMCVVDNLSELRNASFSLMELSFGIEWMIVEKYVDDDELRNIFCDLLGDKMSLIHEYGKRKEQQTLKNVVVNLLESGMSCEEISQRIKMPFEDVLAIKNKM